MKKPKPKPIYEWTDEEKRAQLDYLKKREAALLKPITAEQIIYHSQYLVAVPYAGGFCWIYASKSTGGATSAYGRMKHNGFMIGPHRFALALKLTCSLWELDLAGIRCGHAPADVCVGGRCCNPDHLREEKGVLEGIWQRVEDRKALARMKPDGLPAGQRFLSGRTVVIRTGPRRGKDFFTITVD